MANYTLLKELQQKIDYQFKDENLLFTALTHSSYANEHKLHKIHHNERLEFLGDAVLEVVSSDFLFKNFPDMAEGHAIVGAAVVFHPGHRAALAVLLYLMPDSVAPNRHTCNTHGHQSNKNDKRYFAGFDSGFHSPLLYHRDLQFNINLYFPV